MFEPKASLPVREKKIFNEIRADVTIAWVFSALLLGEVRAVEGRVPFRVFFFWLLFSFFLMASKKKKKSNNNQQTPKLKQSNSFDSK
jgi:hypothetical protein